MYIVALLALFAALSPAIKDLFVLGATRDEVRENCGRPIGHYAPRVGKFFTVDELPGALDTYGDIHDVYNRKTSRNDYRIIVGYRPDKSRSRLNPDARAFSVRMDLDKPLDLANTLDDIAEAARICANGCSVVGTAFGRLSVCQDSPSAAEREVAEGVATWWHVGGEPPSNVGWRLGLEMSWQPTPKYLSTVDWRHKIEQVSLGACDPTADRRSAAGRASVDFGHWHP